MISEIRGKISSFGSNLSDRLEDKLTGDFFGALRYLPFEYGLKGILEQVEFADEKEKNTWIDFLNAQSGFELQYKFWPQHTKGEIDLLLEFDDALVGIEVKYLSGISSVDEGEVVSYDTSLHQLSKYSHMMESLSYQKKSYLIFLAPFSIQHIVQQQLGIDYKVSPSVKLGFVNWEDLHTKLVKMRMLAVGETQKYILADAESLLEVKKLKRFTGFETFDDMEAIQHTPYIYQNEQARKKLLWSWSDTRLEKGREAYVYGSN